MFPFLTAALPFLRRAWPYLLGAVVIGVVGLWLRHSGYEKGYAKAEAEYQAAAIQAGQEFARQLAARDQALAEAQGKVVEVIRWRTRTETVYREALNHDPTCQAWAAAPIGCPLGLPVDPGGTDVPADPAEPHQ